MLPDRDMFPLSYPQERFWLQHQMEPGKASNRINPAIRLRGPLNTHALKRCLDQIIERHEGLRTCFPLVDGIPHQAVVPPFEMPLAHEDLGNLPVGERERETFRRIQEARKTTFDLAQGPLIRATLLRLADEDHILLLSVHHIIFDGASIEAFLRELAALYPAACAGRPCPLPPIELQYRDFTKRQLDIFESGALEGELEYWRERLRNCPAPVRLMNDGPPPGPPGDDEGVVETVLTGRLLDQVRALRKAEGTSLFTTLLATVNVLLQRHTGQDDIVFGMAIGRRSEEFKGLMGNSINSLLLRTDLSGDPSFRAVLQRTQQTTQEAYRHAEVPFEKVIRAVKLRLESTTAPLLPVFCNAIDVSRSKIDVPSLLAERIHTVPQDAPFDLHPYIVLDKETVSIFWVYDTQLFRKSTIERLGRHYMNLLESIVRDPEQRVSELTMLGDDERDRMLIAWNDTTHDYPRDHRLHELFEQQVQRTPDAVAVVFENLRLTYAELDARADRLAQYLRSLGVVPGKLVAICAERSPNLIVGVLGILKAGCAYLPLDPGFPKIRLEFMLEDAGVAALVTTRAGAELAPGVAQFAATRGFPVVDLDSLPTLELDSVAAPPPSAGPDDAAYVIYTSGSTGKPKGVEVAHRNVVNFLESMRREPGLSADDVLLAVTTPSFDIAVLELFLPLIAGGTVVIAPQEALSDGEKLQALLERHAVTVMQATPATWQLLLQSGWTGSTNRLRMLCGGEALPRPLAESLLQHGTELWNMYGPTETTVWSSVLRVEPEDDPGEGPLHLGRPIANTQLYVLDSQGRLVPEGAVGELCIGGDGVARGYLNRPELTAERFVTDPFRGESGARIYRTGDLVRYDWRGRLLFLGRMDHQIKLRGFRIELGEIEAALLQHPAVGQAVAMMRDDGSTGPRLVAYVVARKGEELSVAELKSHARERVPEYEVPSAIVFVDAFPLTMSGKIDRRALPAPGGERSVSEEFVAPRSELESTISKIWRDVLELDHVGIHDNFFDLGGHSILLARVRSRLEDVIQRSLPIISLFRYPTVAALVEHLGEASHATPVLTAARDRSHRRSELAGHTQAIAIVGMSCRFPGASDPDRFWANLRDGVESIRFFDADELNAAGVDAESLGHPDYVRAKGFLDGADLFDASFFGYSPRQAGLIDPQQRLLLEVAHETLDAAGCDPERYQGRIGVFAGVEHSAYGQALRNNPEVMQSASPMDVGIGNDKDHVAMRVSYKLNLRGPSVNVQATCSTSLVAVHLACQSLLLDECSMALAGGVCVTLPLKSGYLYRKGGTLSRDGRCRPFDAEASGMVAGNGVGIVALRRLEDALADGDPIHAIILGSASNNDGSQKVGYTAPGIEGQAEAAATAQALARVDPDTIGYVEPHGTGTTMGDPMEIAALTQVFRERTSRTQFCAIGAMKGNVGHMSAAAGIGGLMKTALVLKHGTIPPTLHFRTPNPEIDFARSPFYVPAEAQPWEAGDVPRRAAVSAYGIGGTNAHVVLEEAPTREPSEPSGRPQLLTLSARTASALDRATENLHRHLTDHEELDLADVAFTLQLGRTRHAYRRVIACRDRADAVATLEGGATKRVSNATSSAEQRRVVFLFTGEGAQYPLMGRGLYESERLYRETVDTCCEALQATLDLDLRDILMPDADDLEEATARIRQNEIAQPALFVTEYALAKLWMSWGVTPCAMIGYGMGEYVAACLAGVFAPEDALRLVASRGRLMGSLPEDIPTATIDTLDRFRAEVEATPRNPPRIPYVSNGGLATLLAREPDAILLEVGPGNTVASLVRRHPDRSVNQPVVTSLHPPHADADDALFLREALGRMWLQGLQPDWVALHADARRRKVLLPSYPFERKRYWIGGEQSVTRRDPLRRIPDPDRWLYAPAWRRLPAPAALSNTALTFLVFLGKSGLDAQVVEGLRDSGNEVVCVTAGEAYECRDARSYLLDPADPEHYARLLADLDARDSWPERVAHFWSVTADEPEDLEDEAFSERCFDLGFYSLVFLMQAVDAHAARRAPDLTIVTSQVHEVTGGERLCPAKAAALGPAKVIPMEFPEVRCRSLDVETPPAGPERDRCSRDLVRDLCATDRGERRRLPRGIPLGADPRERAGARRPGGRTAATLA